MASYFQHRTDLSHLAILYVSRVCRRNLYCLFLHFLVFVCKLISLLKMRNVIKQVISTQEIGQSNQISTMISLRFTSNYNYRFLYSTLNHFRITITGHMNRADLMQSGSKSDHSTLNLSDPICSIMSKHHQEFVTVSVSVV